MLKKLLDQVWTGGSSDSELYAMVAAELASGSMDIGLWTKAVAISDGVTDKAKARYIEMRVRAIRAELANARRIEKEAQRLEDANQRRQQLMQEERQLSREIHDRFESPTVRAKYRRRERVTGIFFLALTIVLPLALWVMAPGREFYAPLALMLVLILVFGMIWGVVNADYGRVELESRLERVQRELTKL